MILVCPSCDAKFKIPDGAIPPEGRKVRCARCKHSWHAQPQQVLKAQAPKPAPAPAAPPPRPASSPAAAPVVHPEVDAGEAARAAALRRSVAEEFDEAPPAPPAASAPVEDDLFDNDGFDDSAVPEPAMAAPSPEDDFDEGPRQSKVDLDADDFGIGAIAKEALGDDFDPDGEDYDDGDFVARRRAEQRRQAERNAVSRQRKLMIVGWAALVIFWLGSLGGLVFMRPTVESMFPGMTNFYAIFEGISDKDRFRPEEGEALTQPVTEREVYVTANLNTDRTRIETIDGRPVLKVHGFVENTGTVAGAMTAAVPQVLVEVLDKKKQVLTSTIVDPPGFAIRRGSQLAFETTVYPVPPGAEQVSVTVLEGTRSRTVSGGGN